MDYGKLIYKVLSGHASEVDKEELNNWLAEDPANAEEYEDIKLLYQADLDFDKNENEQDEHFYDGLRNVQIRIDRIKRKRKIVEFGKLVGASVIISSIVFVVTLNQIHSYRKKEITKESGKSTSAIFLSDNLVFEDVTLKKIFDTLESRYHLSILTGNKNLLSCRFTGTFYRGISIDDLLYTLAESEDLNFTIKAPGEIELEGKGCPI